MINNEKERSVIIFGNGTYESPIFYKSYLFEHPDDFIIAVDGGYNFLRTIGVKPDLLIGDMDSIKFGLPDLDIIQVDSEKDETDTRLALNYCLENKYKNIVMFGMMSIDRTDHSLANLLLLESYFEKGLSIHLLNRFNNIFCLKGPISREFINKKGWTISIIPLTDKVNGVSISGVKYPLENTTLSRLNPDFTVSNEIRSGTCSLTIKEGTVLIDLLKLGL